MSISVHKGAGSVGLKAIWQEVATLPTVAPSSMAKHLALQAWLNTRRAPLTSILTLVTISFALFMLATFLLVIQNIKATLRSSQEDFKVTVYLHEQISDAQAAALAARVRQDPSVATVRLVDKKTALSEFRSSLGEQAAILEGLDDRNPLPQSLEVRLKTEGVAEESYQKFANTFGSDAAVEYVQYSHGFMQQLGALVRVFRLSGSLALAIMLIVTAFIIANTIKLALYAHREEIEIMRLVGATDSYVRTPFLIEGAAQGVIASLISLCGLYLSYSAIASFLFRSQVAQLILPDFRFLSFPVLLVVVLLGVGVGLGGSYFAVRKFSVD